MAGINFDITHADVSGKTGRYCRIQRRGADDYWWDNVNKVFLPTASVNSNIAMTEDIDIHGVYYGTTSHHFANGVYQINLYNDVDEFLISSEKSYKFFDKSLLDMVNEVRRRMRFEQVEDLTDPYSKLLVDFLNTIQNDYMQEDKAWPEMRMVTIATSVVSQQLYQLNPPNMGEFDFIYRIYEYPGGKQLIFFGDAPTEGAIQKPGTPKYYNVQYHTANIPVVFISPDPNVEQQYLIEFYTKPRTMSEDTDIPELHSEAVILGAYAMALESQGNDATMAWQMFQFKLQGLGFSEADIWFDENKVTPT